MFTPRQLNEITFKKDGFGGYDVASVDEVLVSLTQDYAAIYNENEHLKAKLQNLIQKLDEYQNNASGACDSAADSHVTNDG